MVAEALLIGIEDIRSVDGLGNSRSNLTSKLEELKTKLNPVRKNIKRESQLLCVKKVINRVMETEPDINGEI